MRAEPMLLAPKTHLQTSFFKLQSVLFHCELRHDFQQIRPENLVFLPIFLWGHPKLFNF